MTLAERPPGQGGSEGLQLFPWFPSHRVHETEERVRATAVLGQIPLLRGVPGHHLRAIAQVTQRETFTAGETVIKMGDMGSSMYVIRSGRMHVIREVEGAEPLVLATLGPGEFFGELSLFDRRPRSATIVAAEATETLALKRADLLDIINRFPEVSLALLGSLCERLRTADNLLENATRGCVQAKGTGANGAARSDGSSGRP